MLVLSRRATQSVRIGEDIRITLLAVEGNVIRLGIEAPASTKILREELYLSIAAANRAAVDEPADAALLARFMARPSTPATGVVHAADPAG